MAGYPIPDNIVHMVSITHALIAEWLNPQRLRNNVGVTTTTVYSTHESCSSADLCRSAKERGLSPLLYTLNDGSDV